MVEMYKGHEFEALRCRFENQTELLYRMTLLDLRIFSGYITLQLVLGAWIATNTEALSHLSVKTGLIIIDLVLATIAGALPYNDFRRRKEVAAIVRNCNEALGYETEGLYLEKKALNVPTKFRPWAGWYFVGIVAAFVGIVLILFVGAC